MIGFNFHKFASSFEEIYFGNLRCLAHKFIINKYKFLEKILKYYKYNKNLIYMFSIIMLENFSKYKHWIY